MERLVRCLVYLAIAFLLFGAKVQADEIRHGNNLSLGVGAGLTGGVGYLLNDSFTTDDDAPMTSPAPAVPGPGTRTVVDLSNQFSIASGKLVFTPDGGANNAYLRYAAVSREVGRFIIVKPIPAGTVPLNSAGFSTSSSGYIGEGAGYKLGDANLQVASDSSTSRGNSLTMVNGQPSYRASILRTTGAFLLSKTTGNWLLQFVENTGATATLYPGISEDRRYSGINYDFLRIPQTLWTPRPISADAFGGTLIDSNDFASGLGNLVGATWSVAGGVLINAPVAGTEKVTNGNMEIDANWIDIGGPTSNAQSTDQAHSPTHSRKIVASGAGAGCRQDQTGVSGIYYRLDGWLYNDSGQSEFFWNSGVSIGQALTTGAWLNVKSTYRHTGSSNVFGARSFGGAATFYVDDVSLMPLTLSQLFATENTAYSNVRVGAKVTVATGFQGGVVACLDSAASPANFLIAYYNRNDGKIYLDECVAGVYANKFATTTTYGANQVLELSKYGTRVDVYYNGAYVNGAAVTANTNTRHGTFSTGSGASEVSLDDFYVNQSAISPTDGGGLTGLEAGGSGKTWTPSATWSISGGGAVNAPVAVDNVITNGTFDADANWNYDAGVWAIGTGVATKIAGIAGGINQSNRLTAGVWYRESLDLTYSAGTFSTYLGNSGLQISLSSSTGTKTLTARCIGNTYAYISGTINAAGSIDNVVCNPLTLSQLITSILHTGTPDCYMEVDTVVTTAGFQQGIAFNIDDPNNPANLNLIYLNTNDNKVYWDKCVAGTWSNVVAGVAVTPGNYKLAVEKGW